MFGQEAPRGGNRSTRSALDSITARKAAYWQPAVIHVRTKMHSTLKKYEVTGKALESHCNKHVGTVNSAFAKALDGAAGALTEKEVDKHRAAADDWAERYGSFRASNTLPPLFKYQEKSPAEQEALNLERRLHEVRIKSLPYQSMSCWYCKW